MRIKVRIQGQIDEHWSEWFEDLEISHDSQRDETFLCGEVLDQAALYGLLAKLRDLGLSLLSVTVANAGGTDNNALDKGALAEAKELDT
jgi:hypothetical protein